MDFSSAYPSSRKVYVDGGQDVRVPMREIAQSDTPAAFGAERNPPVYVYDTSGPYTDPRARIDIRSRSTYSPNRNAPWRDVPSWTKPSRS